MSKIRFIRRKVSMKGFVCIAQGCYINKDLIDKEKTYYDVIQDRVILFDIYGNKYLVSKDLYDGKI